MRERNQEIEAVAKWAGLDHKDPYLEEYQTATARNDGGMTFGYIATRIELATTT